MEQNATAYPPLTPTEDYPLHPYGHGGLSWACSAPERPRDDSTAYDWRCPACVFAAEAHIAIQGDTAMWWTRTEGAEPTKKLLSWMVARSRWLMT